ncbi:MAG TPA: hypothetical protein VMV92_32840 [Streptosporangiaceae bacterium]|nr:hypothetical protein [Streptosporangiaceae bacterium]
MVGTVIRRLGLTGLATPVAGWWTASWTARNPGTADGISRAA